MSLKDQFDTIKQGVETKRTGEQLKEGKKVFGEIGTEKQVLTDKINGLKELLNQLETGYSSGRADLNEFKDSKAKIEGLYSEYAEYLKEQGIDSVSDILHNESFSGDEEVKKYRQAGAGETDEKGKRGKLGESVEGLRAVKAKTKAALPEIDLDFRGQVAEGQKLSPRQESILKIKNYIQALENEQLASVKEKEAAAKAEYLPKIKEMVVNSLNKIEPNTRQFSIEDRVLGSQLISPEVFAICGDELWPEVKKMAADLIAEKYREQGLSNYGKDINAYLEAEKMVFDVEDLRSKHEKLLQLDRDKNCLSRLGRNIQENFLLGENEHLAVKGGNAYSHELLAEAKYFKEKDPEVKKVCQEVKDKILYILNKASLGLKPALLAGRENRDDMKRTKFSFDQAIKAIKQKEVPDQYYGKDKYDFSNYVVNQLPSFSSMDRWDWYNSTVEPAISEARAELNKVSGSQRPDEDRWNKFSNDRYYFSHHRNVGEVKEGNINNMPAMDIQSHEAYRAISDKQEVDSFLASLEGQAISKEEFAELLKKEQAVFEAEIKNYPNSEAILKRYKVLEEKFSQEFRRNPEVVEAKRRVREGRRPQSSSEQVEFHVVRHEMFD